MEVAVGINEGPAKQHRIITNLNLIRSLDCQAWSLLSFYFLLLVTTQDILVVNFPYLVCIPLMSLVYGVLKLPDKFMGLSNWSARVFRMRLYVLVGAFNFPFVIFMLKNGPRPHYVISSYLAVVALVLYLLRVAAMSQVLGNQYNDPALESEGRMGVRLIYFSVFLLSAVALVFAILPHFKVLQVLATSRLTEIIFILVALICVFPLVLPITLLFRVKSVVLRNLKESVRDF